MIETASKSGLARQKRFAPLRLFGSLLLALGTILGSLAFGLGASAVDPPGPNTYGGEAFAVQALLAGSTLIPKTPEILLPPGGSQTIINVPAAPVVANGTLFASSTVQNPTTADEVVHSSAQAQNVSLLGGSGLLPPLPGNGLVNLTAATSSCTSSGQGSTGTSSIANLSIGGTLIPTPTTGVPNEPVIVPPSLSALVTITANVQSFSNGPFSTFMTVDALVVKVLPGGGNPLVEIDLAESTCRAAGPDIDAPPSVTSVVPNVGPTAGGNSVTITGTHFTGTTSVLFGTTPAAFHVDSSTQITVASAPAGAAGPVDVTVTNAFATSPTGPGDVYTYVPPPTINPPNGNPPGIVPTAGPVGGGTQVTITGSNFIGPLQVLFGTIPVAMPPQPTSLVSQIVVTSPPSLNLQPGSVPVKVTTPGGSVTAIQQFTYVTGPSVSSISPMAGPNAGGTVVTINGANFGTSDTVAFGASPATNVTVVNPNQITATSPPGTSPPSVDVTVTNVGGTSPTGPQDLFTYVGLPSGATIIPAQGSTLGGTHVTITGSPHEFVGPVSLSFGPANPAPSASIAVSTDGSQITAITPPHAIGLVNVTITDPGGSANTTNQFQYVAIPVVTGLVPNSGPVGGGTSVTITGGNFDATDTVFFGANPVTPSNVSSTQMTAVSPAALAPSTVDVTVMNAAGTSQINPADVFTYVGGPTVTKISPTVGPTSGGTVVTITGTDFVQNQSIPLTVKFGTNPATSVQLISPTQVQATSPPGAAGSVDVVVTAVGGSSPTNPSDLFTYKPAPVISTINPNMGPIGGGTVVIITGSNFTNHAQVDFGGTLSAHVIFDSPTQLTVTTPPGPQPPNGGSSITVPVTVIDDGGPSNSNLTFTYVVPPPTVTGLSPSTGSTLGGTKVTITGSNFSGPVTVSFGGQAGTNPTVVDPNTVTVFSPPGTGTVLVTLTDPGGTATAGNFTYYPPPNIIGISPTSGSPFGATVEIVGTNLCLQGSGGQPPIEVIFGPNKSQSFTVSADCTKVIAQAPPGSGTVHVYVTTLGGTAQSPIDFTYIEPGYWMVASDGGVFAFGGAQYFGSVPQVLGPLHRTLNSPIVAMADTPSHNGYWLFAADGGVFTFGDAQYYGSVPDVLVPQHRTLNGPIVAAEPSPSGHGYRMFATDGGVFDFGDAPFVGSLPGIGVMPNQPIEAAVSAPIGQGYWLVARDGGIFTFGTALYEGSLSGLQSSPVISMSATTSGGGYWIFTANGGVFTFGDARPFGNVAGLPLNAPIAFGVSTTTDGGYWMFGVDGGVFSFGDAPFLGSLGDTRLVKPIVGGIGF